MKVARALALLPYNRKLALQSDRDNLGEPTEAILQKNLYRTTSIVHTRKNGGKYWYRAKWLLATYRFRDVPLHYQGLLASVLALVRGE